jgi:threonine dehydrogenase-like Zn-dependent dehydrogenase
MKAAAFLGRKDIRIVEVSEPSAGDDGVVIRMMACGICGSDVHVYSSDLLTQDSTKVIDDYRIIGHEFTGEIVEAGSKVENFKVGDHVVSVHNKGGMAEYVHIPGDRLKNLYKIPRDFSYTVAATLEPFCNPMHSYHLKEPKDNDTVAIFGAGVIGLGSLQATKAYTKARTIMVDVSDIRLEAAKNLGADVVINARETDPVKKIKELTGEHYVRYQDKTAGGCDITIDAAGIPLTLGQALETVKPVEGTVIIAAVYEDDFTVDPNMIMFKYMTVFGSMGYYDHESAEALDLIVSGKVDRKPLISHTMPLEEVLEGFKLQADSSKSVKVVLVND